MIKFNNDADEVLPNTYYLCENHDGVKLIKNLEVLPRSKVEIYFIGECINYLTDNQSIGIWNREKITHYFKEKTIKEITKSYPELFI